MIRGSLKLLTTTLLAGAVILGTATGASASGQVVVPTVAVNSQQATVPATTDPAVQQIVELLRAGEAVRIEQPGGTALIVRLSGSALSAVAEESTAGSGGVHANACWKAYVAASAITGVGAAAILTIVAAGLAVGATEITIVGLTLTPGAWAAVAGCMGSWSALLAMVSKYTC